MANRLTQSATPTTPPGERTLHPTPHHPATVALALPIDFSAFTLLHYDHYLSYTQLRLGEPTAADQTLQATWGDLAITWPHALSTHRPAAVAWHALGLRINTALTHSPDRAGRDVMHRLLPADQADAVILRHFLGMSDAQAADVIGRDPAHVTYQLLDAERRLGRRIAKRPRIASART